jgi:hypothetical protein
MKIMYFSCEFTTNQEGKKRRLFSFTFPPPNYLGHFRTLGHFLDSFKKFLIQKNLFFLIFFKQISHRKLF